MLILGNTSLLLIEPLHQHQNTDKKMNISGHLKKLHEQGTRRLLSSRRVSRENREKSDPDPQLEVEDDVYPLPQRLPTRETTRRLDIDKVVPSLISGLSGPGNYEVRLLGETKIHPRSSKSLFEPADLTSPLLTIFHSQTEEEEDEFEVEEILRRRGQRYLIKWKGYPHSENTWEPIQNLGNCQMVLRQFRRTAKSRRHLPAEPSRSTP